LPENSLIIPSLLRGKVRDFLMASKGQMNNKKLLPIFHESP
jgi:hypothetical protein